jgi:hypothetical protein
LPAIVGSPDAFVRGGDHRAALPGAIEMKSDYARKAARQAGGNSSKEEGSESGRNSRTEVAGGCHQGCRQMLRRVSPTSRFWLRSLPRLWRLGPAPQTCAWLTRSISCERLAQVNLVSVLTCELLRSHQKAAKQKTMKEHGFSGKKLLIGPSYPFTANDIFSKLHKSLEEQRGRRIGYEELGTLLGKSKGSAHAIFRVYRQRPLLEFFSLLKQLVPHRRHALVDALCRTAKEIK